MSVRITIGSQVIEFPSSGADPNWAPAVIDFAQAVETAHCLRKVPRSTFLPKVQILTSDSKYVS
jgi:hypothetical protein